MKYLISDVHGDKELLTHLINNSKTNEIILLGDIGFGFGIDMEVFTQFGDRKFIIIQGNHDNGDLMKYMPNIVTYNTNYGFHYDHDQKILYIPGALSYDKSQRTIGIDWWENEEMRYEQLMNLLDFFYLNKQEIKTIISHDTPESIYLKFFDSTTRSRTNQCLDLLFDNIIGEDLSINWYHGHLHIPYNYRYNNFNIIGLDQNTGMYIL